jgi:hypothetical protein
MASLEDSPVLEKPQGVGRDGWSRMGTAGPQKMTEAGDFRKPAGTFVHSMKTAEERAE